MKKKIMLELCRDEKITLESFKKVFDKKYFIPSEIFFTEIPIYELFSNICLTQEIFNFLIESGDTKSFTQKDKYGCTPLHCLFGNPALTIQMLKFTINLVDLNKNSGYYEPLFYVLCGNACLTIELLKYACENGASFYVTERLGENSLTRLCRNPRVTLEILRFAKSRCSDFADQKDAHFYLFTNKNVTLAMLKEIDKINYNDSLIKFGIQTNTVNSVCIKSAVFSFSLNKNYNIDNAYYQKYCRGELLLNKKKFKYIPLCGQRIMIILLLIFKNICIDKNILLKIVQWTLCV